MTSNDSTIKLEWREASQQMADWVTSIRAQVNSDFETDLAGFRNPGPIAVMGRWDTRSDLVDAITSAGKRATKVRERPDSLRRYFISRVQCPVSNSFEKKKEWTRQEQIDAFRNYVWNEWIDKGNIRPNADKWLRARAAEVNSGVLIDLVSDSRQYSRKRAGGFVSKKDPYDCHGHVIRALILIVAGQITKDDYFATQAEYILKMEGDPVEWDWKQEAKEIIAARDSTSEPWSE